MSEVINDQKNSTFLAANLIRIVGFLLVTVLLIGGTFFFENRVGAKVKAEIDQKNVSEKEVLDFSRENILSDGTILRFEAGKILPKIELESSSAVHIFKVDAANFWANFQLSSKNSNILLGNVLLIPDHAAFNVNFDGEKIDLAIYKGDVYVGFLPEDFELSQFFDQYAEVFLNRLLVPQDTQVSISLKKVNEKIAPLLPAKLMKEFKYSSIPSNSKASQWINGNIKADEKTIDSKKREEISKIISQGTVINKGFFASTLFFTQKNFTFVPEKKQQLLLAEAFSQLNNAIFYSTKNNDVEVQNALNDFDINLISFDISQNSEEFQTLMDKYIQELSVFGPQDKQYEVYKFLLNKKFNFGIANFKVVDAFWRDVYKGIDENSVLTEKALSNYYDYFDRTIGDNSDQNFYTMYLSYQNQLFDNLLLRYPIFYKDSYFAIKDVFEQNLLKIYPEGQSKDELKQSFVSTKIDFLKRLRKFFFDGDIDAITAKQIFSRLFEEINNLMPVDSSAVAVIKLFEAQLADADDFWGYLNSPEYHTGTYGLNDEERFKNYLKEREQIWSFIKIQEEVLGESVREENDILDVVAEIEEALEQNPTLTDLEIGSIESPSQRNVEIKGVIGGYPFKALYDRDFESLTEVYSYDELISERAVKIDSLLTILQNKFADLAEVKNPAEEEEITLETTAERYARLYIAKLISEYGFEVDFENVSILNEREAIYNVKQVNFNDIEGIKITFDIVMNGERVRNVFLEINSESRVIQGEFSLQELADLIKAESDFSLEETPEGSVRR